MQGTQEKTDGGVARLAAAGRAARRKAARAGRVWPFHGETGAGPEGQLFLTRIGDLTLAVAEGRPVVRADAAQRAGGHAVALWALDTGAAVFKGAGGRLRPLRRGEVLLAHSADPLDIRGELGARLVCLSLPGHLLSPRFVAHERLRGGAQRAHAGGVSGLLAELILRLASPHLAAPGAGALTDAVGGLISATLEDCWAAEDGDSVERLGRARMEAIGQYLRRHFADPNLSPSDVAEAIGVSRRYLHKLYTAENRSFRRDLITLRIEACVKAFADAKQAGKTIADIAFAAGYTDISQFNRHFRKLKGATPSSVRAAMASGVGSRKAA